VFGASATSTAAPSACRRQPPVGLPVGRRPQAIGSERHAGARRFAGAGLLHAGGQAGRLATAQLPVAVGDDPADALARPTAVVV